MSLSKVLYEQLGFEFTMKDAYNVVPDKPKTTIRARIYDNLGIKFERVKKGLYRTIRGDNQCILIEGNGRDLNFLEDNSIDCILTDHPWLDSKSNKGGNRDFSSSYSCFRYELEDFKEKARVLKEGHFLVEVLPAENESNYEYLYEIKQMAKECGLLYYAKVPWIKGNFVSNTGRKSKNSEDIMIFSKGKARELRKDVKKTLKTGNESFMSGTNGMLPTDFNIEPVKKKEKIHESEKPVQLYEEILNYITMENEIVLDQYAGSGNVGLASLRKKRSCILIEIIKENVEKIKERLNASLVLNY